MSTVEATKAEENTFEESAAEAPKVHAGMGAIIHDQGVAFRVWAPHAEEVSIVGTFNDWDPRANPCERDDHDNWYADVSNAKPGDEYRFWLRNGDKTISRIDPR
jgi:1,4-alpha-glucan branching enzyme